MSRIKRSRIIRLVAVYTLIGLASLLLFISCAGVPTETGYIENSSGIEVTRVSVGINRVVDVEAGVVCWMLYGSGISCLPISETLLDK